MGTLTLKSVITLIKMVTSYGVSDINTEINFRTYHIEQKLGLDISALGSLITMEHPKRTYLGSHIYQRL